MNYTDPRRKDQKVATKGQERRAAGQRTRDRIIFEAFVLFCTRQYDNVSYLDLEQATGLTRGAITYHFKDKHALFAAVIERHWLGAKMLVLDIKLRKSDVLRSFIDDYTRNCEKLKRTLTGRGIRNVSRAYSILESSAFCFFDNFGERYRQMRQSELAIWTRAIEQAARQGEISLAAEVEDGAVAGCGSAAPTAAALAMLFMNIYTGHISASTKSETGVDTRQLRAELLTIYELVRE